jgi:membrane protease YdiL (CAAX protease family)
MSATTTPGAGVRGRMRFFVACLILQAMVFAILPLSARLPMDALLIAQAGLAAALLLAALYLRRREVGRPYWQVAYVLFVAAAAVLASTLFSDGLVGVFDFPQGSPPWIAVAKFSEGLCRVVAILVLMALIGADRRTLYLGPGRSRTGLAAGIGGFVVLSAFAFISLPEQHEAASRLLPLLPWILLFVLANGFTEELLFRGLFLGRYEPFLGKGLANLLTAVVFTLAHVQVNYVADVLGFLMIVFPLALAWGYLMQKSDSLWGSAIFHAGADCMIVFSIFASY